MIVEFAKAAKEKKKGVKKDITIYQNGFYSLGGFIAGFLMVHVWHLLNIPHFNEKINVSVVTHEPLKNPKGITTDKTVALMISTALMMSELVGVKGGMSSGGGFLLGYTAAASLKTGKTVGSS
jgi:hypothetical protein